MALPVPTGAVGAAAAGAGAACTDQALQAGHSFLLQPLPEGAGSKLVVGVGAAPAQSSQITLRKREAFAVLGGLVGYILSLQETVLLQSLRLCPHLKYIYLYTTGFRQQSNAWQSISVLLSGMGNFPIAVSWDES